MQKNSVRYIVIFSLSLASLSFAGKGSIYSRYGIGEMNVWQSDRLAGMGNSGLALTGESFINLLNPASLGTIKHSLIYGSYQSGNYVIDGAAGSATLQTGNINSFSVALPVYAPTQSTITFSLMPLSRSGYEFTSVTNIGTAQVTQRTQGNGGLNSAQSSLSYLITPELTIGLTYHYLFGSMSELQSLEYQSTEYFKGSSQSTVSMNGSALTFGFQWSGFGDFIRLPFARNMILGGTFFSGSSLQYEQETLRNYSSNQDTVLLPGKTLTLPISVALGIALQTNSAVYSIDFQFHNWKNYAVGGVAVPELQNSFRLLAGMEIPADQENAEHFYNRISYRFGGYVGSTNLKLKNTSINEMFITMGIGFPVAFDAKMNLALEYGMRGTQNASLYQENIFRITAGVTISELMFIPPEIE